MKERGLTFRPEMAAAIWRGDKWQTRRLAKQFENVGKEVPWAICPAAESGWIAWFGERAKNIEARAKNIEAFTKKSYTHGTPARFEVGGVMIVREPWRTAIALDDYRPSQMLGLQMIPPIWWSDGTVSHANNETPGRLRPAMFMPLAFARMRRQVTAVRFERLGDISEADAIAEGIAIPCSPCGECLVPEFHRPYACAYATLWEHLYGPGAWERDKDKWVEVIEFERRAGA